MARSKSILIAAGAIGTAAAIGFVMQAAPERVAEPLAPATPISEQVLSQGELDQKAPERVELSEITLTSSSTPAQPKVRAAAPKLDTTATAQSDALPEAARVDDTCPVLMKAEPTVAAMVNLTFSSKCDPYTRVSLEHEGMIFTELTNSMGVIEITVPALSEYARFIARLPVGDAAVATVRVDSVAFYDRSVVQSEGRSGISLHALEFGTDYDSDSHVWAENPRDPAVAARGEGGFLMILGDETLPEARIAQVYTFPTGTSQTSGDVRLSVEVAVITENCERLVKADAYQVSGGMPANWQDVSMSMPSCDAVGDYLLLKTPLNDLKIASR
ncbi:MAG: hypothetical protein ACRBBU_02865 [Pseudooceanicola sp.]